MELRSGRWLACRERARRALTVAPVAPPTTPCGIFPTSRALRFTLAVGLSLVCAIGAVTAYNALTAPLTIASGSIAIAGTSNVHACTASTAVVRVTRVQLADGVAGPTFWDNVLEPGAVEAFEIAIPAASLTSPKKDLDKSMHKALNATQHQNITFRLLRLEPRPGTPGAFGGIGVLPALSLSGAADAEASAAFSR